MFSGISREKKVEQVSAPSAEYIVILNLPPGTTEKSLADFLWESLGLNLPLDAIKIEAVNTVSVARKGERFATIALRRETLAEFFTRYLAGIPMNGNALIVKPLNSKRRAALALRYAQQSTK
jgi:hypothetical protein